jgi:hypothetical protein
MKAGHSGYSRPEDGPGPRATLALFLLFATPLVAGAFLHAGWAWGFDHLRRAGPAFSAAFLAAGAFMWIPPLSRGCDWAFARFGERIRPGGSVFPILLALIGIAVFAACPIATRIYGDSKVIIDDHTPQHLRVYLDRMLSLGVQQRGSATFAFHDIVSRLTGLSFERTFMIVSVLCGGIFLFAGARMIGGLPKTNGWTRAAILWLLITDGANQLFFGHVETYTLPRLFETLFLIEVVASLLREPERPPTRGPILRGVAWFVLAVLFHLQALVLLPTLVMWLARAAGGRRPALRPWTGRRLAAVGVGLAFACVIGAYLAFGSGCYDYIYSGGRPQPRQIFIPLTTACTGLPYLRYTLFSSAHLLDVIGGLWSISSPAILLALFLYMRGGWKDERTHVLLPAIAVGFLHDFMLNSAIGYPFDWDLMCVISPPLLFTAIFLLARNGAGSDDPPARGLAPDAPPQPAPSTSAPPGLAASLLFLGLATAALFGINANRVRVYHRVEDMGIWLHKTYYGGSHYRLSANLSTITDPKEQIAERARVAERIAPDAYPDDREVAFLFERLALKRIEIQDYPAALDAYRHALATEPSRWEREKPVGYLESEVGNPEEGIRLLSDYLKRAPKDAEGWLFLGNVCAAGGLSEPARRSWTRFLELTPQAPEAPHVREELQRLSGS